jgi:DNA-binding PadR family transcriptional regulator
MGSKKDTLGDFELLVMLAVLRLGDEAYAVPIVDEIAERTGRSPSRSAVYLTLKRLEEAGLVASEMGDPLPERGGKARRYVQVRPEGLRLVRETQDGLRRMWDGLEIAEADAGGGGRS